MTKAERKVVERKVRRALTRTLSKDFDLGGWDPAALASWLVPPVMRACYPKKRARKKP